MSNDFDKFLETFDSQNTIKVMKSLKAIGEYDYTDCTPIDLQNIVLDLKPNSPKAITTIIYVLSLYVKYLGKEDVYYMIQDLDRNVLWSLAKPNASKKFISHSNFEKTCKEIELYEKYNSVYISSLFRCLYEGIYNDDMSVVKNLRASDINGNVVILRPDNEDSYELEISEKLANDLIKLGKIDTWSRRNRYGEVKIKTLGIYKDSCFKVENRKGSPEYAYRFSYYRMLRKISKEYLEYNLLPLQLFVSGVVYRIKLNLEERGIGLRDAFSDNNRDRIVSSVISDELNRCAYETPVRNFREMVKGHIEIFDN